MRLVEHDYDGEDRLLVIDPDRHGRTLAPPVKLPSSGSGTTDLRRRADVQPGQAHGIGAAAAAVIRGY